MKPVHEFRRSRWSPTRKKIDAMKKGQVATFHSLEKNNVITSVYRLRFAYNGSRNWSIRTERCRSLRVTRIK